MNHILNKIFFDTASKIIRDNKNNKELWIIRWTIQEMFIHIENKRSMGFYDSMYDFVRKLDTYSLVNKPSSYIFSKAYDIVIEFLDDFDLNLRRKKNEI